MTCRPITKSSIPAQGAHQVHEALGALTVLLLIRRPHTPDALSRSRAPRAPSPVCWLIRPSHKAGERSRSRPPRAPSPKCWLIRPPRRTAARPESTTESTFADVLAEVMSVERVSVDSNFFDDLGADSMVMARFCARVRKRPDLPSVSIKDIYQHPTIRSLATALTDAVPVPRRCLSSGCSPTCWLRS